MVKKVNAAEKISDKDEEQNNDETYIGTLWKFKTGRNIAVKKGDTVVYLPKRLTNAENWPFEGTLSIRAEILGEGILLTEPEWWELINWKKVVNRTMARAPQKLREEIGIMTGQLQLEYKNQTGKFKPDRFKSMARKLAASLLSDI